MSTYRTTIRCRDERCNRVIPLKDGKRMINGKTITCPNGHENMFIRKKGKGVFKVVLK